MIMPYTDLTGWFDFEDFYDKIANEAKTGDTIVEVGVYNGKSLTYLALQLERMRIHDGKRVNLYGVDDCRYIQIGAVRESFKSCGVPSDRIKLIKEKSPGAKQHFQNRSLFCVYVDADHTYESVLADLDGWWDKVAHRGYLAGHDYFDPQYPGVKQAVDKFCKTHKLDCEFLGMSYFIQRR